MNTYTPYIDFGSLKRAPMTLPSCSSLEEAVALRRTFLNSYGPTSLLYTPTKDEAEARIKKNHKEHPTAYIKPSPKRAYTRRAIPGDEAEPKTKSKSKPSLSSDVSEAIINLRKIQNTPKTAPKTVSKSKPKPDTLSFEPEISELANKPKTKAKPKTKSKTKETKTNG